MALSPEGNAFEPQTGLGESGCPGGLWPASRESGSIWLPWLAQAKRHAKSSSPSPHTHREASCPDSWMQFWAALDAHLASCLRISIGPWEEQASQAQELDARNQIRQSGEPVITVQGAHFMPEGPLFSHLPSPAMTRTHPASALSLPVAVITLVCPSHQTESLEGSTRPSPLNSAPSSARHTGGAFCTNQ